MNIALWVVYARNHLKWNKTEAITNLTKDND